MSIITTLDVPTVRFANKTVRGVFMVAASASTEQAHFVDVFSSMISAQTWVEDVLCAYFGLHYTEAADMVNEALARMVNLAEEG